MVRAIDATGIINKIGIQAAALKRILRTAQLTDPKIPTFSDNTGLNLTNLESAVFKKTLSETLHADRLNSVRPWKNRRQGKGEKLRTLLVRLFKALHRIYRLL